MSRLDAFLSHAGLGSRKEVRGLLRKGLVRVDGTVTKNQSLQLPDDAVVTCRGEPVIAPPSTLHLLFHKPVGLACSHDQREAPLIYDQLPELWRRAGVESAGRLDRATSGLLFLSTDGGLLHRLIHPKRKVAKRYRITYSGELRRDAIKRCAAGMLLPDDERPTLPATLTLNGPGQATLVLHEGRFHQVRRMIAALGGTVTALHRDRFGALELPTELIAGEMREATEAEVALLRSNPDQADGTDSDGAKDQHQNQ